MRSECLSKKLLDINKTIRFMENKNYGTDSSIEYIERLKRFRKLYLRCLQESLEKEEIKDRLI